LAAPVVIRPFEPADMADVTRIRTSVRENHLSVAQMAALGITPASFLELLNTTGRAWVAAIDETLVGFSVANAGKSTLFGLFVQPDHEGMGIGKGLLAEAEAWLFAQGCREIWLDTGAEPELRAHGFYRRQGWALKGPGVPGELRYIKRASDSLPATR
jgi:dimethylamine monooxygenase subunit A